MELILASSSPRRQELLRAAGISFVAKPSNVPEDLLPGETPYDFTKRLAREKATAVWNLIARTPETLVLGADTIVVIDQHIMGKPEDGEDATRMLRMLSGREHFVITGVCLVGHDIADVRTETTVVFVNPITDREIADYIASGEPMDKAGAYGIQGLFSRWVQRIEGDYTNVVGLPMGLVYRMLTEHKAI